MRPLQEHNTRINQEVPVLLPTLALFITNFLLLLLPLLVAIDTLKIKYILYIYILFMCVS